jgi:hypothetical protein
MTLSFPSPEFDDTVAAVCHGSATEDEMRALNALLRSDARARDEYLMRIEVHTRLASERDLFPQQVDMAASFRSASINTPDSRNLLSLSPAVPATKKRLIQVLAMAVCLMFIAGGAWALWFRRPATRNGTTSAAVAMLTRAVDARWSQSTHPLRVGSALEPRVLRLEAGLAQVVFYSGARVVMEGPAELRLVSGNEAICLTGRLLAEVPPAAHGFRLKTGQVNVVDLGTAFGIDATAGRTEVHVFKGKVELLRGTASEQSLAEGQAALVRGSDPSQLMAANPDAFGPMFDFQTRSMASEAVRYDQWRLTSAQLSQDPSLVVHFDFENLSDSDWLMPNTVEKNRSVQDATIVGCQRAEGRWREKQALEFQNVNDRVRLAVPGDFQSLTLSAWVCVKGLDRQFNSLFMSDGFDPGTIHWLIRNDGVLGLTVFGQENRKFQILSSPPVMTLDKIGMWTHLVAVIDGKARQAVQYVNGFPVSRDSLKLGPPFRIGSAELGNWNRRSDANPTPSLIRNLSGSLDEFELFNRALSDAEVRGLYAKGKPDLEQ